MRRLVIALFSVVVVFILFVVLCTYVKRPYEKILVVRFGSLIEEQNQARMMGNWYFKYPTDSLVRVDTRLHLKSLPNVEFPTASKELINVRAYVVWHIVDPKKFALKADGSDEKAEDFISQRVLGMIPQNLGTRNMSDFFNIDPKTEEAIRAMETKIARDATTSGSATAPGLQEIGVEIADVGFSRLAFPAQNTDAVYGRMVADLNKRSREYESQGTSQAETIRADGLSQATEITAGARRKADGIRGEADGKAIAIMAEVTKTDAQKEFYQYWKSMEFLKASLSKNTIWVLSTDSLFLKQLFGAAQVNFGPVPATQAAPNSPAAPEKK